MGFDKNHIVKFDEPKTLAYRADIDDLAKYLYRMLTEDDLMKKMGENARKHAVENFDYLKTSKDINDLIEKKLDLKNSSQEQATVSVQEP